jgi:hypothetical protein
MATYSPNLAITKPDDGEFSGTWGQITNTNLGTLIEQAISGYETQAMFAAADVTLNMSNGAYSMCRNMYIQCTGIMSQVNNLIVPTNRKLYFIHNATTGGPGYAITVKTASGSSVSVPNGAKMVLVCDGSGIVEAINNVNFTNLSLTNLTASGAVTAATVTSTGQASLGYVTLTAGTAALAINGIYRPAVNQFAVTTNSVERLVVSSAGTWSYKMTAGGNTIDLTNGTTTFQMYLENLFNGANIGLGTNHPLGFITNGVIVGRFAAGGGLTIAAPATTTIPALVATGAALTPSVSVGTAGVTAATLSVNAALSNVFYTTLTAGTNVGTVTITNPTEGQTINIFVTQPSTGSGSTMVATWAKWPGGSANGALSTAVNSVDLIVATYRNSLWYATIAKAFS